jgi:hypothetical protein
MVGTFDKLRKYGNLAWNGISNVNAVAQTVAPLISEVSGIPIVGTVVNAFG